MNRYKINRSVIYGTILLTIISTFAANGEIPLPKGIIKLNGDPAPSLVLTDIDENKFDLKQYQGKWVFVHFWATWCGPCRKEMPTINQIYPQFKDSKLKIVVINTAESEDIIFNFLGIAAPDMVPLLDRDGLVTAKWRPRGLPSTYFVDPKGKLRYLALGGRPWNEKTYIDFLQALSISPNEIQ
ncbi:MAG: TlpA family protein disulfide reductase [Thiohalomonadales bacterium]